ncbi:MAG: glycoside hydrolase family 20 protein [Marinifilaceae bacterium]
MKQSMFSRIGAIACVLSLTSCLSGGPKETANYQVVPLPQEIIQAENVAPFILDKKVKVTYPAGNEKMQKNADFLAAYIKEAIGTAPEIVSTGDAKKSINLQLGLNSENEEAYELNVSENGVTIIGASEAGVFYGIQTLRKAIPQSDVVALPAVKINDYPRFPYRGMMLDVSRHTFSLDSIKRYIDILALHNINRFHWHITDDQGWRLEIKKHPKLIELGSKRRETVIGRNSGKYDGKAYDGYFTQEQAKEVVAYAAERYITVIPEIDMPGHMLGALTAYPELGCTGGPYEPWTMWGVADDVLCPGNDQTLAFIEDVLTEVMEIFPSQYIHVGGDECPKVRWEKCPKCQARIKALGIKGDKHHSAEEYLQSFVINHAEKFLNKNGRAMIGWDEILEGGLAPNATVMSWRGMKGGIEAAKQGHDVIMTPTTYLYFDYYQSKDTKAEPLAIGGYVPVEMVYNMNPVPAELNAAEAKHIIGVQANVWTEYMPTFSHVEYMVLPRMAALSEVQWTAGDKKDYNNFLSRMPQMFKAYDVQNYNYAQHLFDIDAKFNPNYTEGVLDVTLSTLDDAPIYYTLDGTEPTTASPKYDGVVKVKESAEFKAAAFRNSKMSRIYTENIKFNKATLKPITMLQNINKQYEYNGAATLVDGLKGDRNYKTGNWIAFFGNDMESVIDLLSDTEISSASITTNVEKGDWTFDARGFEVAVSNDGKNFKVVASEEYPAMTKDDKNGLYNHELTFDATSARYVKITVKSEQSIPAWHGGKGNKGFLFLDEICIN